MTQSPDITITHDGTSWTMTAEQWIDLATNGPPTPRERATMRAVIYHLVHSETEVVLGAVSRFHGHYQWASTAAYSEAFYATADAALEALGAQFATAPVHVVKLEESDAS